MENIVRKKIKIILFLIGFWLVSLFVYGFVYIDKSKERFPKYITPDVSVLKVTERNVYRHKYYPGIIHPKKIVDIRPLVPGRIIKTYFKEGTYVKKGDVLFQIDPTPFKTRIASLQTKLASQKAGLDLSLKELKNIKILLQRNQVPEIEYDSLSKHIEILKGDIASTESELNLEKLKLDYTSVIAPFTGRVGKILIDEGSIVESGGNSQVLTSLSTINPTLIQFSIDETTYNEILFEDLNPISQLTFELVDTTGMESGIRGGLSGKILSVDNQYDRQTGTIEAIGQLDKANENFLPGMYFKVKLNIPFSKQRIVIPNSAVLSSYSSNYVYVLDKNNKAQKRTVELGSNASNGRVIQAGIEIGESIIIEGLPKVKSGRKVKPHEVKFDQVSEVNFH